MDCIVHRVTKSWTRLSDFHFLNCYWDATDFIIVLVVQSCLTIGDPMDCSLPDSLSIEFSRQEYWSGLPFPPLGDLDSGIELGSPALWADSLLSEPLRK